MIQHLLILLGNCFISFNLISFISKRFGGSSSIMRMGILLVLYTILGGLHIQLYKEQRTTNYYEKMDINRVFTHQELKRSYRNYMKTSHPDKIFDEKKKKEAETLYIEIQNINEILSNKEYKQMYERFGEVEVKAKKQHKKQEVDDSEIFAERKSFMLSIDMYFYYAIAFTLSIVMTQEQEVIYARKWCIVTLVVSVFLDFIYVQGMVDEIFEGYDIFDSILPQTTFKERSYIIRLLFGVIINYFRSAAFVNDDRSLEKIQHDSQQLLNNYINLIKQVQQQPNVVMNCQEFQKQISDKTDKQFSNLMVALDKNVKGKEKNTAGVLYKLKKIFKFVLQLVLFAMSLYFMYNTIFGNEDEEQKEHQQRRQQHREARFQNN